MTRRVKWSILMLALGSSGLPAACDSSPWDLPPDQVISTALSKIDVSIQPNPTQFGFWDHDRQKFLLLTAEELTAKIGAARNIHITTHGWQPKAEVILQRVGDGQPPLTAWDERLVVDGLRQNMAMDKFADASTSPDTQSIALGFSWLKDAAKFSPEEPIARAGPNAEWLVKGLAAILPPGWRENGGRIHLFGHSAGARLVCIAASLMNPPPEHLTLADGPELTYPPFFTPADLNYIVIANAIRDGRMSIGRGPGQTFIDNYISQFGIPYGAISGINGVVDVALVAPPETTAHLYSQEWYANAAAARVPVGPGWSPLLGTSTPAASFYLQDWQLADGSFDPAREFVLAPQPPAARIPVFTSDPHLQSLAISGPVTFTEGVGLRLTEKACAIWTSAIAVADVDRALTFDYLCSDYQDDTVIMVWVEDQLRFISLPPAEDPEGSVNLDGTRWQRGVISLSNLGLGGKLLRIGIRNTGESVRVEGFAKVSLPRINPIYPTAP